MRTRRSHSVSFAIMVPLISIMLFSSTTVPGLPSVIISPSPSLSLPIQEAFAQDGDEEEESESQSSEESSDGSTDEEPSDGSTDEPRQCDPPEVPCDDGTGSPPEPPEPNCPEGQVLEDGECVDPTDITCSEGQVLENGECVEPPEPPTRCDPPEVPCNGAGGTGPTEPPTRCDPACIPPTPTPQPTPTPVPTSPTPTTNSTSPSPGGVIQQPSAAAPPKVCSGFWNVDGNAPAPLSPSAPSETTNSVTLEGDIIVQVNVEGKKGTLPIENAKVELRNKVDGTPAVKTNTEDKGKYTLSPPEDFLTVCPILRVTLQNNDPQVKFPNDKFGIHHASQGSDVVFVETILTKENLKEIGNRKYMANIKFEINSDLPQNKLYLNDRLLLPSTKMNDQNIELGRYPQLAAIYFYINHGVKFINEDLKDVRKGSNNKQLKVVGFVAGRQTGGSVFIPGVIWSIEIPDGDSRLFIRTGNANEIKKDIDPTESSLDGILHEFGHYTSTRINGLTDIRTAPHDDLKNKPAFRSMFGTLHIGYAAKESAASLYEAVATFLSAKISEDFPGTDTVNRKFKNNAHIYIQLSGTNLALSHKLYLEEGTLDGKGYPLHIVGPKIKYRTPDDKTLGIHYSYDPIYEQASLASVLWDLGDGANDDNVQIVLPQLLKEILHPTLSYSKGIGITFYDVYNSMIHDTPALQAYYDKIFANFGICTDSNDNGVCTPEEVKQRGGRTDWKSRVSAKDEATNKVETAVLAYPAGRP